MLNKIFLRLSTPLLLLSFVISVQAQSESLDVTTSNCNTEYGCFRSPSDCQNSECLFLAKWRPSDDSHFTDFVVSAKRVDTENQYVATGFSLDDKMNDDLVVMCKQFKDGSFSIQNYFNQYFRTTLLNKQNPSHGLTNLVATSHNGRLSCTFRIVNQQPKSLAPFSLTSNNTLYLFLAQGEVLDDQPQAHLNVRPSSSAINFSLKFEVATKSHKLAKAHGALMIFAWLFFASVGIIFARYYKFIFPTVRLCGLQFWFIVHRPFMLLAVVVSLVSLVIILFDKNWQWVQVTSTFNFVHSILGISTIGLAFIQPILAIFRPDKDAPKRPIFNWVHRSIGVLTFILAMAAILMGMMMFLESFYWLIMFGWLTWLVVLVIFLEFIDYKMKMGKKKFESKQVGNVNEINVKINLRINENFKIFFMVLHILVSIAFATSFILFIAIA